MRKVCEVRMNAHLKRIIKIFLSPFYRIGLKNRNFSIISNNCWGGHYYDKYHLKYLTPTIGLFIPPKDYLKFINNIHYYLNLDLQHVLAKECNCYGMLLRKVEAGYIENADALIIGKLGDIEIVFLHYTTFEDAKMKWNRRKDRINFNNLIIKFNDQNELEEEDFFEFQKIKYRNKIFFTSNKKYKEFENVFYIKKYEKLGFALDDLHSGFDMKKYLNSIK